MKKLGVAISAFALWASAALAGEFFEKEGVALRGYDPVAYFTDGKPVKGDGQFTASYKDSKFQFASKEHLDQFTADPAKYAPQYGGYCAFGMASGYKAATDPNAFSVVDGKLYLNYNADIQTQWKADVPGFIEKANAAWPEAMKLEKVIE